MSLLASDKEIHTIAQEVGKGQNFLISLLSGRLTSFISLLISALVALVLSAFLLWHPDNPNTAGIITILGIIGGGATGVGNITSIIHGFIAAKQPSGTASAPAAPLAALAALNGAQVPSGGA